MKLISGLTGYKRSAFFMSEAIDVQALKYGYKAPEILIDKGYMIVPNSSKKALRGIVWAFLDGDQADITGVIGDFYKKSRKAGPECRMFCVCMYLLSLGNCEPAFRKLIPMVYGGTFQGEKLAQEYTLVLALETDPFILTPEIYIMLLIRQNGRRNRTDKALRLMLKAIKSGTIVREEFVKNILRSAGTRNEFILFLKILNKLFPETDVDERGDADEGFYDGRKSA